MRRGPDTSKIKRKSRGKVRVMPQSKFLHRLEAARRFGPRGKVRVVRRLPTPTNWDAKQGARATIRSACVAAEQRFSRSNRNPLHVWEAIWMCTSPDVAPMMLPDWCIAYLHEVAQGLLAAEGDGEKLAALIARQLKLTRAGWTAVKTRASAARAISAAGRYNELRFCDRMSSEEAYEKVREAERLADVSSARKLVKRGHAMLRHVPHPP